MSTDGGKRFEILLLWNQLYIERSSPRFRFTASVDEVRLIRVRRIDLRWVRPYALGLLALLVASVAATVSLPSPGHWLGVLFLTMLFIFPPLLLAALVRWRNAVRVEPTPRAGWTFDEQWFWELHPLEFWLDDRESPGLAAVVDAVEQHGSDDTGKTAQAA